MKKLYTIAILMTTIIGMAGCSNNTTIATPGGNRSGDIKQIPCKNPRSKMCTKEYMPVCGEQIHKTYSNGCMACADSRVEYYTKGKCE